MIDKALFEYAKDSTALVGSWDGTGGVAAEDSVAEPRNDGISELTHRVGDTDQEVAEPRPAVSRMAENVKGTDDGVGAAIEALVVSESISDQDDAFGSAGGSGHGDELLGDATLKGGEAEVATVVVAEDETNNPVTEGADAVIEENRAAFDLESFRFRHVVVASDSYTV